jgi:hypothetical protein
LSAKLHPLFVASRFVQWLYDAKIMDLIGQGIAGGRLPPEEAVVMIGPA